MSAEKSNLANFFDTRIRKQNRQYIFLFTRTKNVACSQLVLVDEDDDLIWSSRKSMRSSQSWNMKNEAVAASIENS